jgi:hypothetical protein
MLIKFRTLSLPHAGHPTFIITASRTAFRPLTDVQSSLCHLLAAPAKPLFINQLIDTIQSPSYNRRRAAGKLGDTKPTDIHWNAAYQ